VENKQIIEKLSEEFVLLDIEDKQSLGTVHNLFEELAEGLEKEQYQQIVENTLECVENLILDEAENPEQAFGEVNQVITGLQQVIIEGKSFEESEFPKRFLPDQDQATPQTQSSSLPDNVEEEIFAEFLSKQESALQELEAILIEVEKSDSEEEWRNLKAILHTMKGESAMVGLDNVEKRCHSAEDLIEQGEPSEQIDELFELKDWLTKTFKSYMRGEDSEQTEEEEEAEEERREIEDSELLVDFINEAGEHIETLDRELLQIESDPTDSDSLNSLFRAFHTIKGVAGFLNLDDIQKLSHVSEDLLDSARKGKIYLETEIIDTIFNAVDKLKELIENLRTGLKEGLYPAKDRQVPGLIDRISTLNEEALKGKKSKPAKKTKQKKTQSKSKKKTKSDKSPTPKKSTKSSKKVKSPRVQVKETIKISADKLDRMVDMIGELVIAESMVSQSDKIDEVESLDLEKKLTRLDKITRELQEIGLSLRMIPVRSTFHKMARLVRDLSKKSGKPINFVLEGKDTELDKSVVEKIGDPLVHLLRNAVDHGIEPPEEREAAGKDKEGTVELRAFHKSGKIYIEVEDDGRGLDADSIIEKAISRGIIDSADSLSKREIWNLVFEPGFSTAKQVTDISGRGVGMDVVRKNIESLRGKIQILSEKGKGSKFTIQLPLTLAVIDGMVIRLGDDRFIIPTLSVITSVRVKDGEVSTVTNKGEVIKFQNEMVPIFRLGKFFNIQDCQSEITEGIVVIVQSDGKRVGLFTDRLLGQEQIVIKSLSEALKRVPGVAGGTIMPDGKVALILDIGGLVQYSGNGSKVKQEA